MVDEQRILHGLRVKNGFVTKAHGDLCCSKLDLELLNIVAENLVLIALTLLAPKGFGCEQ